MAIGPEQAIFIERAAFAHLDAWCELRAALWPDLSAEGHRAELEAVLRAGEGRAAAFIARAGAAAVIGFAEATLRTDHVNGCAGSPVVFLEGIHVAPAHRRRGVARLLCAAVQGWGQAEGCTEFASDALLDNPGSHRFHAALGFAETERVVFFRKPI